LHYTVTVSQGVIVNYTYSWLVTYRVRWPGPGKCSR